MLVLRSSRAFEDFSDFSRIINHFIKILPRSSVIDISHGWQKDGPTTFINASVNVFGPELIEQRCSRARDRVQAELAQKNPQTNPTDVRTSVRACVRAWAFNWSSTRKHKRVNNSRNGNGGPRITRARSLAGRHSNIDTLTICRMLMQLVVATAAIHARVVRDKFCWAKEGSGRFGRRPLRVRVDTRFVFSLDGRECTLNELLEYLHATPNGQINNIDRQRNSTAEHRECIGMNAWDVAKNNARVWHVGGIECEMCWVKSNAFRWSDYMYVCRLKSGASIRIRIDASMPSICPSEFCWPVCSFTTPSIRAATQFRTAADGIRSVCVFGFPMHFIRFCRLTHFNVLWCLQVCSTNDSSDIELSNLPANINNQTNRAELVGLEGCEFCSCWYGIFRWHCVGGSSLANWFEGMINTVYLTNRWANSPTTSSRWHSNRRIDTSSCPDECSINLQSHDSWQATTSSDGDASNDKSLHHSYGRVCVNHTGHTFQPAPKARMRRCDPFTPEMDTESPQSIVCRRHIVALHTFCVAGVSVWFGRWSKIERWSAV